MAATPFHLRSFVSGAAFGLLTASAAAVIMWHPDRPRPLVSYAQQGEDYLMQDVFAHLVNIEHPTYIDIGANDPILNNNTYAFYTSGSHGVLVEPNPEYTDKLRKTRPRDVVLDVGIGAAADDVVVDYYVMKTAGGQLNTFSAEAAKSRDVKTVIKRTLVNVNKILAEHFPSGGPDLFSVDAEGYDLIILQSLDFDRFRPKVICAETLEDDKHVQKQIIDLLESKNYEVRAGTVVNTIFVDRQYLAKVWRWQDH